MNEDEVALLVEPKDPLCQVQCVVVDGLFDESLISDSSELRFLLAG